jgi:PTS system cellobiose-specific IIC component
MGLVFCYLRSRSVHLRSIGRLSIVPSMFNINEPVIFGTPIVMNPVFFIPFLLAPLVNAIIAWAAMKMDLIGRVISVVPWTAPAPIGGAWALGWDFRAAFLSLSSRLSPPSFTTRSLKCMRNSYWNRKRKRRNAQKKASKWPK